MGKTRVRICLKDIYRYIAIRKATSILGITEWNAMTGGINVKYEGSKYFKHYDTFNEDDRRHVIKLINKRISEVN